MGFVAYFQKRYEEAKSRFNKLLHENNDVKTKASGHFGLAHLYYHDKNYILLKDTCEKIIRLDTTFYDKETLGYFLCHAYLHLKMWPELSSFFQELESSYPNGRYSTEYKAFRQVLKNHGVESN